MSDTWATHMYAQSVNALQFGSWRHIAPMAEGTWQVSTPVASEHAAQREQTKMRRVCAVCLQSCNTQKRPHDAQNAVGALAARCSYGRGDLHASRQPRTTHRKWAGVARMHRHLAVNGASYAQAAAVTLLPQSVSLRERPTAKHALAHSPTATLI